MSLSVNGGCYEWPWILNGKAIQLSGESRKSRGWKFHDQWTSFFLGAGANGTRIKRMWTTPEDLADFIDCAKSSGFKADWMPSSYAAYWHELYRAPRPLPTTLERMRIDRSVWPCPSKPGPWSEAIVRGKIEGVVNHYDLNSAYAGACLKPLPLPTCPVYVPRPTPRRFGFYLIRSAQWGVPAVPARLRGERQHWVTKEELEHYDASKVDFIRGIEFEGEEDLRFQIDAVCRALPQRHWKRVLRAFWGAWQGSEGVEQFVLGGGEARACKPLPAFHHCPPFAWTILSRIGIRCAEAGGADLVHVATDGVMVRGRTLATGDGIGQWKHVATYDALDVSVSGRYSNAGVQIKGKERIRPMEAAVRLGL